MKSCYIKNGLVVAVILLFIGLVVQPSIAVQPRIEKAVQTEEETIGIEPKDYLFQTIIDIANNSDVKNLLEQYKYDLFKVDIERSIYLKIFLRNPILLPRLIFTKPSMSQNYLDFVYNQGVKIIDIIGEDKALEIMESIEVSNLEVFDKLDTIINDNEELTNRFATLKEMNNVLSPVASFDEYPIICIILSAIGFPSLFLMMTFGTIAEFVGSGIIGDILLILISIPYYTFGFIFIICMEIAINLGCAF